MLIVEVVKWVWELVRSLVSIPVGMIFPDVKVRVGLSLSGIETFMLLVVGALTTWVVLSSEVRIIVSSLSEAVAVKLPVTETGEVLGLNLMDPVNGGTGTTDTVELTRTVTTTEDGLSLLETKTEVVAASLLGMRPVIVLSLSGIAVGDDSEV